MYVIIDNARYTALRALSFNPSADLVGARVPINGFQADLYTDDDVDIGGYAELYDDADTLWARYWVVYAEHIDRHTLRVRAQSDAALLDRVKLPAVYYDNRPVESVLNDTLLQDARGSDIYFVLDYRLDESFEGQTLTGFCPEQTARERLTWICFVLGAYVKAFFNDALEILPIDDTEAVIPASDTYWKPAITYRDYVTAIRGKAYAFAPGTPQAADRYVVDAQGTTYLVTETEIVLRNPDAPAAAPENMIDVEGVYLLNDGNISAVLSHLALWYFKRAEVDLSAIDNGAYMPGDRVRAMVDDETLATGTIDSAAFRFGLQAKAVLHLTAATILKLPRSGGGGGDDDPDAQYGRAGNLVILYLYGETQIGRRSYLFPVGTPYSVTNPFIDSTMNGHRYIFRPINALATGTIAAGPNENRQSCAVALDHCRGVLEIVSVDSAEIDDRGVVRIP